MKFRQGDHVIFKGNPSEEFEILDLDSSDDTYLISFSPGTEDAWIPERLLELAPVRPKQGELLRHEPTGTTFYVSWVSDDGSLLRYTSTGWTDHVTANTDVFNEFYVRVHPPLEV